MFKVTVEEARSDAQRMARRTGQPVHVVQIKTSGKFAAVLIVRQDTMVLIETVEA